LSASTIVLAHDTGSRLTKPALANNLDYLEEGLVKNLPLTPYTVNKWDPGYIPSECKHIASGEVYSSVKYDPADFEIYDVHYSDCGDPWVFCHHKDSNITLDSMASQFSRLPVQMREWVRHVVDVPSDNGWAFEWDGTITFIRPVDDMVTTIVHETGHSLDLSGAYADKSLSDSDNWWNNYDQDTHVPDPYAQSNMIEDVAQNTVVALYNENVPGGFGGIEPGWQSIFHQYATLITEAREAGDGNSILVPGQAQTCSHRL
ncbi:putative conidiation-specific protein, partial [Thozetella sp. PMI_491]